LEKSFVEMISRRVVIELISEKIEVDSDKEAGEATEGWKVDIDLIIIDNPLSLCCKHFCKISICSP
jgi:hypothetical protein